MRTMLSGGRFARRAWDQPAVKAGLLRGVYGLAIVLAFLFGFALMQLDSGQLRRNQEVTLYAISVGIHAAVSVAIFLPLYHNMMNLKRRALSNHSWAPFLIGYFAFASVLGGFAFITRSLVLTDEAVIPLSSLDIRISVSYVLGFVATAPGIIGLWLVQAALNRTKSQLVHSAVEQPANVLEELLYIAGVVRRFFIALGASVGVSTLSSDAYRNAVLATTEADFPAAYILAFGALLAAGLSFIYVPLHLALQSTGRAFRDTLFPTPPDPKDWPDWQGTRRTLEEVLGLGATLDRTFPTAFAILAPFIGSLVSVFLPAPSEAP